MQPNDLGQPVASAAPAAPVTPAAPAPMAPAAPAKKSSGMILGMILLAILAAGGIGFGVWAYMNGNNQPAPQQPECTKCDVPEESAYENPVIKSDNANETYMVFRTIPLILDDGQKSIYIYIKDGKVNSCEIFGALAGGGYAGEESCTISGLEGEVYDVVGFNAGQAAFTNIGFIMTDGTVKYIPYESITNKDFSVKGTLNIDGYVVSTTEVSVHNGMSGYAATVFVLRDGTFVKFDDSMLQ